MLVKQSFKNQESILIGNAFFSIKNIIHKSIMHVTLIQIRLLIFSSFLNIYIHMRRLNNPDVFINQSPTHGLGYRCIIQASNIFIFIYLHVQICENIQWYREIGVNLMVLPREKNSYFILHKMSHLECSYQLLFISYQICTYFIGRR